MSKWVVNIKGKAGAAPFEISVLRDDNGHGKLSYGWHGPDKIMISNDGGPCRDTVPPLVWGKLIRVAQEVADELNAAEAR
jgi:hypothetical protein